MLPLISVAYFILTGYPQQPGHQPGQHQQQQPAMMPPPGGMAPSYPPQKMGSSGGMMGGPPMPGYNSQYANQPGMYTVLIGKSAKPNV